MTSKRAQLNGFEERLLGELKNVVAQRADDRPPPLARARTPLWRRPHVVSMVAAGALAVAVGVPLLGGRTTAPPANAAFDVRANDDGTVTVTIYRFDDADGLEAQLEGYGVSADVTYTPIGEHCQADRYDTSPTQHHVDVDNPTPAGVPLNMNDVELSFTLRPADFQPNETLVVENAWAGADTNPPKAGAVQQFQLVHVVTAIGPVEPCELEAR
jgi:hypothetical protein